MLIKRFEPNANVGPALHIYWDGLLNHLDDSNEGDPFNSVDPIQ